MVSHGAPQRRARGDGGGKWGKRGGERIGREKDRGRHTYGGVGFYCRKGGYFPGVLFLLLRSPANGEVGVLLTWAML